MSATEAKVKALHDLKIVKPESHTGYRYINRFPLIGLTQQGEKTPTLDREPL